jgi:hypothetical protein
MTSLFTSRRSLFGVAAVALLALGSFVRFGAAQERGGKADVEPRQSVHEFMLRKLTHVQGVVAGLSMRKLDDVAQHADKLGLLCIDEQWNVIASADYVERSTTFRRTIASLAKAARDQKPERAELACLDLVGQCFSCHQAVRDAKTSGATGAK